uniref:Uncharacterized protein n=1 Tax=Chenopodium quinoa TaxID=63459 RepID=A0A803N799_CHEQI
MDSIIVVGYPLGGDTISVTKDMVSQIEGFKEWVLQRERFSSTNNDRQTMHEVNNQSTNDDINGLLHDTFRDVGEGLNRDHEVERIDLMNELENFENDFGKKSKGGGGKDIPGKTRDHNKARLDLLDLGIKPHLHPSPSEDSSHMLFPPAPYSMSNAKKDLFLKVLKETKLPYGYASNIGRVPRDLFDFEEALNEETYWEEPIDSSSNNMPSFDANHIHVGAGGGEVRAVNINDLSDSEDVNNLEDDIDYDDTYWDWMDATDDIPAHEP